MASSFRFVNVFWDIMITAKINNVNSAIILA